MSETISIARLMMQEVVTNFTRLVQPSLVAIYESHPNREGFPVQVGTGFLIAQGSRPVLITAKHTLRGQSFQDSPNDKAVHVNGDWVYITDPIRNVIEPENHDVAVAYMDEFPLDRCLSTPVLSFGSDHPKIVTLGGFLARDFKRLGDGLYPAPRIYSNVGIAMGPSLVGLRYPKRRNIDTRTGNAAVSSVPSGLSGGPMLDTFALFRGTVSLVGVFTNQSDGKAWGENANVLQATLTSL